MKLKKRYIAGLAVLLFLIIVAATHTLWLEAIARFLIVKGELSPADAIAVLGGGGPERVKHGVDLYKSGYGAKIIVTGMKNKLPGLTVTWSQLAMREGVSLGVPENVFILEERSTSTYEDAKYVKEDMVNGNFKSVIIVSSSYHIRRVRMTFRKVFKDRKDISLQFSPVEDENFQVHRWWTRENELINVVNEYCKLIFYLFKYII